MPFAGSRHFSHTTERTSVFVYFICAVMVQLTFGHCPNSKQSCAFSKIYISENGRLASEIRDGLTKNFEEKFRFLLEFHGIQWILRIRWWI